MLQAETATHPSRDVGGLPGPGSISARPERLLRRSPSWPAGPDPERNPRMLRRVCGVSQSGALAEWPIVAARFAAWRSCEVKSILDSTGLVFSILCAPNPRGIRRDESRPRLGDAAR